MNAQLARLEYEIAQLTHQPQFHLTDYEIASNGGVTRINLSSVGLTEIPSSLYTFVDLEILSLKSNQLSSINSDLGMLTKLIDLDLSENCLVELPASIAHLSQLETLTLDCNQLDLLPNALCHLTRLRMLSLLDNGLKQLPEQIGQLSELEVLMVESNELTTLPPSFTLLS